MPDLHFTHPRLAAVYDVVDGERSDLLAYLSLAGELGATSLFDIGCGTGSLACGAATAGIAVTAVDPAAASVEVARAKAGAEKVRFIVGPAGAALPLEVELVTMTGNVAQVFLGDEEWSEVLGVAHQALTPGGHLVFESRQPEARAWEAWTTRERFETAAGAVEVSREVTAVKLPFVSFLTTYRFEEDGAVLCSASTLCFRDRQELEAGLAAAGFDIEGVREAPDRPGLELVFIARRP